MILPEGTAKQKEQKDEIKTRVIRMEFSTYLQTIIQIPAQIIRTSQRLIYGLLTFRSSAEIVFTAFAHVRRPLRC